jgi:hypothetical protein
MHSSLFKLYRYIVRVVDMPPTLADAVHGATAKKKRAPRSRHRGAQKNGPAKSTTSDLGKRKKPPRNNEEKIADLQTRKTNQQNTGKRGLLQIAQNCSFLCLCKTNPALDVKNCNILRYFALGDFAPVW